MAAEQPSGRESEQMRRSMLEQTEADEWDELPSVVRLRLLAEEMDETEDLSEEQAQWLKDESEQAMEDLKTAFESLANTLGEMIKPVMEDMQPLVKLAEDIENNAE